MTSRRKCLNHPDKFCYICGEFCTSENRKSVTDFVQQAYIWHTLIAGLVIRTKSGPLTLCASVALNTSGNGLKAKGRVYLLVFL